MHLYRTGQPKAQGNPRVDVQSVSLSDVVLLALQCRDWGLLPAPHKHNISPSPVIRVLSRTLLLVGHVWRVESSRESEDDGWIPSLADLGHGLAHAAGEGAPLGVRGGGGADHHGGLDSLDCLNERVRPRVLMHKWQLMVLQMFGSGPHHKPPAVVQPDAPARLWYRYLLISCNGVSEQVGNGNARFPSPHQHEPLLAQLLRPNCSQQARQRDGSHSL
mmetsp:Transcript_37902/g.52628  ORF Transcript_37902/g.52628 Transcript_37902/m.52628 type:complete len:218 (+) Transcript_37902:619-1272(+)